MISKLNDYMKAALYSLVLAVILAACSGANQALSNYESSSFYDELSDRTVYTSAPFRIEYNDSNRDLRMRAATACSGQSACTPDTTSIVIANRTSSRELDLTVYPRTQVVANGDTLIDIEQPVRDAGGLYDIYSRRSATAEAFYFTMSWNDFERVAESEDAYVKIGTNYFPISTARRIKLQNLVALLEGRSQVTPQ